MEAKAREARAQMKTRLLLFAVILFTVTAAIAAKQPLSPPRIASGTIDSAMITIKYSAPSVRGRSNIFGPGGLISKDKTYPVWRAGANAATSFAASENIRIGSLAVSRGHYTLFADIKNPDAWVLIVNKQTGQWGLTYNSKMDLGRVSMKMTVPSSPIETLNYKIEEKGGNRGLLVLSWDRHVASVPIEVTP